MQSEKNSLLFSEPFGTMFSIHLRARRQSASNDKRMAVETSSLGGGKNEMLHSVNARSGESWRRDKNVSIYANCCPDPPPGCHCLLSGEKIKGPSVLNLFPDSALFRGTSLLAFRGQARFHGGAERAAYPLVLIRGRKLILSL